MRLRKTAVRRETPVRTHPEIPVSHIPVRLYGDASRSIILPFNAGERSFLDSVVEYVTGLPEEDIRSAVDRTLSSFTVRHPRFEETLEERFRIVESIHGPIEGQSRERRMLIGAYFTMEYSIEAAALFNPSIAPLPDQSGAPRNGMRFIMSLRAVGEGHISTTVFRTGVIGPGRLLSLDPRSGKSANPRLVPDALYHRDLMKRRLHDLGIDDDTADLVFQEVPERFTYAELDAATAEAHRKHGEDPRLPRAVSALEWLARANCTLRLADADSVSDLVLYPRADAEFKGIEDMRLVRFTEEDGRRTWFGTFTGYDGRSILPMLMETADFRSIALHTLNGACAQNKGMALFPRRIGGHYAMCSRIDGRNLYLMFSDIVHFWESAEILARPKYCWEYRLMGNCGSPMETPEGWLLITHGVGPVRRYGIGAMLLDAGDPFRIRGRLKEPLLIPENQGRRGYVPNVVYSCGSLIHRGRLYLPYAVSDSFTRIAGIPLERLLDRILRDGP